MRMHSHSCTCAWTDLPCLDQVFVDGVYAFEDAKAALERSLERRAVGKIVVDVNPTSAIKAAAAEEEEAEKELVA